MNKLAKQSTKATAQLSNSKPKRPRFRKAQPGEGEMAVARYHAILAELKMHETQSPCDAVEIVREMRDKE